MRGFHSLKRGVLLESREEVKRRQQVQQVQWVKARIHSKSCKYGKICHHLKYSLLPLWSLIFLASSSDGVCSDTFTSGTVTREQSEGVSLMRARGSDQQYDLACPPPLSNVPYAPAPVRTCLRWSISYWVSGCRNSDFTRKRAAAEFPTD